jgi:hypothetical protein
VTLYHDSATVKRDMIREARRWPYPQWHLEPKPVKRKLDSLKKTIAWLHIRYLKIFESNGRGYKLYEYYPSGKTAHKEIIDWNKKTAEEKYCEEDGKLMWYNTYDKQNDKQVERYYDPRQTIVKKCVTCGDYFDTKKTLVAIPEMVYVQ